MTDKTKSNSRNGLYLPLGFKLTIALALAAALMLLFLFCYFGPDSTQSFAKGSDELISLSRGSMNGMAQENIRESKNLLINLIRQTTDSRRRQLMDLPLSLYKGDIGLIRVAIEKSDTEKSARLQLNVEILAKEMERRSLLEIDQRLDKLCAEQSRLGEAFASDIRESYLVVACIVFMALVLLLGFGLYHAIVHPLYRLRNATKAVMRGDLDFNLPGGSNDEVGGLSADFAAMVLQLKESQEAVRDKNEELKELNRNLESEVARKTRHLEKALIDLKNTQKQLIHAEKMASIGTLAGGVAHEFNNLIGGIRGCAADILETEDLGDLQEPLEVIMRATKKATEITTQLLRFSKQKALKMQLLNIPAVIEDALLLIEPAARKRKVTVNRKIEKTPVINGDSDALHQVLLNLYTNALQAMPDGGEMTIVAHQVEKEIIVRIIDSGVGIPADRINRIFEPFFTTKDQEQDSFYRGSGLGLSVSYSIIEAHAGSLEATSEKNKGSVFTIKIPINPSLEDNS